MNKKSLQNSSEMREWRKLFNPSKVKEQDAEKIASKLSSKGKEKRQEPVFSL